MIKLPRQAAALINRLETRGYEAFAVGGCVRDSILGRTPGDWDICTSANPDELKACFEGFRIIETGLKHGTLTIFVDERPYEVTSYRIDGFYSDGRRPDKVAFTPRLEEDLSRRDFTINAMAWNPRIGLVDRFGGMEDLRKRLIRCVGKGEKRFSEDGLRIMRAVRFASQLEFQAEEETARALRLCCPLLSRIAPERIRMEFDKLLLGPGAAKSLNNYRDIIACIIPEAAPMFELDQKNPYHVYTVWEHTLLAVSHVKPLPELKLAAFFHDIGKPGSMTVDPRGSGHFYKHEALSETITRQVMQRLRYDSCTLERVTALVKNHSIVFVPACRQARRLLARLGEDLLRLLMELECADVKSQNPRYTQERLDNIAAFGQTVDQVLAEEQCFSLKQLAANGRDLIDLGIPQGPEIGRILQDLLQQVLEGTLSNEKHFLLEAAERSAGIYAEKAEEKGIKT